MMIYIAHSYSYLIDISQLEDCTGFKVGRFPCVCVPNLASIIE